MNDRRESPPRLHLSIGQCASLAIILEATAPKPGNVHRGADFEDLTYPDFMVAATMIGPMMEGAVQLPLGQTVLSAIEATQLAVETNTSLGTVLLIAPLAKVPRVTPLTAGLPAVLQQLTAQDAHDVYRAILLAKPGGMGKVNQADLSGTPPDDLVAAMRLAQDRDMVARQYANQFHDIFHTVVPWLQEAWQAGMSISRAVVHVQLRLMSQFPDSLIARQRGPEVAQRSAAMAAAVLEAGQPGDEAYENALDDLDFWLRSDHHARNPGTTADLIAAGLFVALRDGLLKPPFRLMY